MSSKRKIHSLNLELETPPKVLRSLAQKYKMECHYPSQHNIEHEIHGDIPMMNTMIDLIISLGIRIEEFDKQLTSISRHIEHRNLFFNNLEENLQYIKTQNDDILKRTNQAKRKPEVIPSETLSPLQKEILIECQEIKQVLKEMKQIIIS